MSLEYKDLIHILVPTVPAVLAFIQSFNNSKKIKLVHVDINSRVTELVKAIKESSHASGVALGIEQERQRQEQIQKDETQH